LPLRVADPLHPQLLQMNRLVTGDNLFFKSLHLFLVHGLNLRVPVQVRLLKMFELFLQLFKLLGNSFVVLGELFVIVPEYLVVLFQILL
jgi:hypothetical protein